MSAAQRPPNMPLFEDVIRRYAGLKWRGRRGERTKERQMNAERLLCVLLALLGHVTADRRRPQRRLPGGRKCPPCDAVRCPEPEACRGGGAVVPDPCRCCPTCLAGTPPGGATDAGPTPLQSPASPHGLNEQSEACAKISCPKFQVCMLNIQGIPMCRCPTKFWCMKGERNPVCGADDVTYKSKCFLRMAECERNESIGVRRRGKCVRSEKDRLLRQDRIKQKQLKSQKKLEKKKLKMEKIERKMRRKERRHRKRKKKKKTKGRRPKNKRWMAQ